MKATEILMNEHRVIEQVLACLERMADDAERQGRAEAGPGRTALRFFRGFADRCHHGKEEHQLFPLLESRGLSPESGPTAVMRLEHVQGRELLARIDAAIDGAAAGRAPDLEAFVRAAREYVVLLRDHIVKEDQCLFPMAEQALDARDQETLVRTFRRVDRDELGERTHRELLALADELADRYRVPRAAARETVGPAD